VNNNNQVGWDVAIRLEENRVHIAEWITGLSAVVIAVASSLLLQRIGDIKNGEVQVLVFVFFLLGLLFAAVSLGLGIWYYVRYMEALYLNPCYLKREKSQGNPLKKKYKDWSTEKMTEKHKSLNGFLPRLLNGQLTCFSIGISFVFIAIGLFAFQAFCL